MLCRKCGSNFGGSGIYCGRCLNPAPETPIPQKVRIQEIKTSRPAVIGAVTSPVFLISLCLMTLSLFILIFSAVPYLNSINGLFEKLGATDFLDKVAPGARFAVFIGMLPTALATVGLWVLYFKVKDTSAGARCVGLVKSATLVKYIYSLSVLAFSTLAVFFLSFKWVSVFKDIGFSYLLVLGVVSAVGIRLIVNFISVRISSESLRNIKEAERALTGYASSVNVTFTPVKLTLVAAVLNFALAWVTGSGIMIFYAGLQMVSATAFGITAGKFKKFIRAGA